MRVSGVAPANQTKERLARELFTGHSRTKLQCESCLFSYRKCREAKPGGFQTRVSPTDLSGKVQIVSRTLSGLFLVGALNRPRKRKGLIGKIPGPSPSKSENPRQFGKVPKRTKKDKKGRTSPDRETPPFETPPFSGP